MGEGIHRGVVVVNENITVGEYDVGGLEQQIMPLMRGAVFDEQAHVCLQSFDSDDGGSTSLCSFHDAMKSVAGEHWPFGDANFDLVAQRHVATLNCRQCLAVR